MKLLASSWVRSQENGTFPNDFLKAEKARLGLPRRSDRLSIAAISAVDSLSCRPSSDAAMLFGSMLGPQGRICAFQDDLMDYPEEQASPFSFSHSVHNSVQAQVSIRFRLSGPACSISGGTDLPLRMFQLADAFLREETAPQALLLFFEERSIVADRVWASLAVPPMEFALAILCAPSSDSMPMPPDYLTFIKETMHDARTD